MPIHASGNIASSAQIRLIYLAGTRDPHMTQEEPEDRYMERYVRLPLQLTKREASESIDSLKSSGTAKPR